MCVIFMCAIFMVHRQTVEIKIKQCEDERGQQRTQIRCPHYLLTGISIPNEVEMKKRYNWTLTHPVKMDSKVNSARGL